MQKKKHRKWKKFSSEIVDYIMLKFENLNSNPVAGRAKQFY